MTLGLARGKKEYTSFIRIDFSALPDKKWKNSFAKRILSSHIFSANVKSSLLEYQKIARSIHSPLRILYRSILLLMGRGVKKEHIESHDTKVEHVGFSTRIIIGSSDTS